MMTQTAMTQTGIDRPATTSRKRLRRRERGITLLMSLIIIIALLALGLMGVWISSMSTHVAGSLNARQQASNAAMAGIQHGRLLLTAVANTATTSCSTNQLNPWTCVLAGQNNSKDLLPTSSNPKNYGAILYDGATPLIGISSPSGGTTPVVGSYTVWVRNDGADIAAAAASASPNTNMLVDTNGTVILRAEGRDPSGTALVVLEAATTRQATAASAAITNTIFGKNIDPYGSNALTGSFHF